MRRHGEKALGEQLATNMKLRYWEGGNTVLERWNSSVLERAGVETAVTHEPANHEMGNWTARAGGIVVRKQQRRGLRRGQYAPRKALGPCRYQTHVPDTRISEI